MGIKVKRTLGTRIFNISEQLNIPRVTVESVVRAYLEGLVESAKNGENIVIDNIMSIKLIREATGEVTLRGRVSPALKNKLAGISIANTVDEEDLAE